jgi:DnaK suppressor protein
LYQLLHERDQNKLKQIHQALDAIEAKTYGVCEDCGEKIGKKRLIALPFTKLCVDCKNEEERTKGISRATSDISSFTGSDTGEL